MGIMPTWKYSRSWRRRPCREEAVDLRRHDEIVFMEAPDRVGPETHLAVPPSDGQVRVVPLGLRDLSNLLCEPHRLSEIPEPEFAEDSFGILLEPPAGDLGNQPSRLLRSHRRNPAPARNA